MDEAALIRALKDDLRVALQTIVRLERERAGFQNWVNEVATLFRGKSPGEVMEELEGLRREITLLEIRRLRTEEAWAKKFTSRCDV